MMREYDIIVLGESVTLEARPIASGVGSSRF
jgi:hypothetical protein